eukprot:scaffold234_cov353-Pavlova_lutheri.AAC.5
MLSSIKCAWRGWNSVLGIQPSSFQFIFKANLALKQQLRLPDNIAFELHGKRPDAPSNAEKGAAG